MNRADGSLTPPPHPAILAVNSGSSSLKFALYPIANQVLAPNVLSGSISGLQPGGRPILSYKAEGHIIEHALSATGEAFRTALQTLVELLAQQYAAYSLSAIAHRVVHGGTDFNHSVQVSAPIMEKLAALSPLAPLHQPHNLAGIRLFQQHYPHVPQIACFDTAFHTSLPPLEYTFALPQHLAAQGVRRYGYHGLSYQYVQHALADWTQAAKRKLIMAHLGNGASLCAAQEGRSIATTMGFSTLDGLMMGTRCGAIDPGVLLHLTHTGWNERQIEHMLYQESGLLGVSGVSADMRTLRASASPAAKFAIELFAYRIIRESGGLAACLGGLDALVFTGGIGEHDAPLRERICTQLAYLGIKIDPQRNLTADGQRIAYIHHEESIVEIWVVPTDEGKQAAREALALLADR